MTAALPLAILFTVIPMGLFVATTQASGIFQLRPADAPPLTHYERYRQFALLNWHWPLLVVLSIYALYAFITEPNPVLLIYALSAIALPMAAFGPRLIAWGTLIALATTLVYVQFFMSA